MAGRSAGLGEGVGAAVRSIIVAVVDSDVRRVVPETRIEVAELDPAHRAARWSLGLGSGTGRWRCLVGLACFLLRFLACGDGFELLRQLRVQTRVESLRLLHRAEN